MDAEFTPDVFHDLIPEFIEEAKKFGYSKTPLKVNKAVLKALYIFLDYNQLNYHPEIAVQWADAFKGSLSNSAIKKALFQFDDFVRNGTFDPTKIYTYKPIQLEQLPPYYQSQVQRFLDFKQREGWASSTIVMYRSCAVRFCQYMISSGVLSFSSITPDTVISFSLTDSHKTHEGRQAYLSRVKGFLLFLYDEDIITDPTVIRAVRTVQAPRVRIIQTLTQDQVDAILDFYNSADKPLELRDSAVLLLGMKMGLRGIDVVNLKFSDINWKNRTIHILQQKTKVELRLPMPTIVGNAIYRYIKDGRPESDSPNIFLTHRAPFNRMSRSQATTAVRRRIPGIKTDQGFHILRKTFASELLRRGSSRAKVSAALGHRGSKTVNQYLNLDEERIRQCSLDLTAFNLPMNWGDICDR